MKVAFVQDWFTVDGGAEKVSREILLLFPEADVFGLIDFLSDRDRESVLLGKYAKVSPLQRIPMVKRIYRNLLPLFPGAIERFDLSQYDLIISSSYAVAKGVLTHSGQKHICYCHSPMRYAWDLTHDYLNQMRSPFGLKRFMARVFLRKIRIWDVVSSNRVDVFIANSKNVQNRIQKIYRRESIVIHPPVDVNAFQLEMDKEDYYITASRLVPYKHTETIVKAFLESPDKKLIVCGDGPLLSNLKRIAGGAENIQILGHIPRAELNEKISKSKAFIIASHEDFGIAPVEALACGTPVVCYAQGGALETVIEGKNGIYFHHQTAEAIKDALDRLEKSTLLPPEEIRNTALPFSKEAFGISFKKIVDQSIVS